MQYYFNYAIVSRRHFLQNSSNWVTETIIKFEIIEAVVDLGREGDIIFVRVQWKGLPVERAFTWHPLTELYEDVPGLLKEFLLKTSNMSLATEVSKLLVIFK